MTTQQSAKIMLPNGQFMEVQIPALKKILISALVNRNHSTVLESESYKTANHLFDWIAREHRS